MKFALIDGTRICEFVATAEQCFPVAEPLMWVAVPDDTTTQDQYIDGDVVKARVVKPMPGPDWSWGPRFVDMIGRN